MQVNAVDRFGNTPLEDAVRHNKATAKVLLSNEYPPHVISGIFCPTLFSAGKFLLHEGRGGTGLRCRPANIMLCCRADTIHSGRAGRYM